VAYLKKMPQEKLENSLIVVNLSGRGDKDMIQAKDILHFN
jgi:tryptophan synthase beta chain